MYYLAALVDHWAKTNDHRFDIILITYKLSNFRSKTLWKQLLKCEYLHLFFDLYENLLNILGFVQSVGQNKALLKSKPIGQNLKRLMDTDNQYLQTYYNQELSVNHHQTTPAYLKSSCIFTQEHRNHCF